MENIQTSTTQAPIVLSMLDNPLPLPEGATISHYKVNYEKKPAKQTLKKKKYTHFSYYKIKENSIIKILWLDTERYLEVSRFPFTEDVLQIRQMKDFDALDPVRLITFESLFVGERKQDLVIRKLNKCQVDEKEQSVDTIQDHFQKLPLDNRQRLTKLVNLLKSKSSNKTASIRVIVLEENQNGKILDYDFFFIEKEYLKRYNTKQ